MLTDQQEPQKIAEPYNTDTEENVLHFLARWGCCNHNMGLQFVARWASCDNDMGLGSQVRLLWQQHGTPEPGEALKTIWDTTIWYFLQSSKMYFYNFFLHG